jgi:hypothetical protein
VTSAQTIFEYRAAFDALLDDGYSEEEARETLGPQEVPTWTHERIVEALQEWAVRHRRSPKSTDWIGAADDRPTATTVITKFGMWKNALAAAGLVEEPRRLVGEEPEADVEIPPMPEDYVPHWGRNGAQGGTRAPAGPTKTPGHNAKAITSSLERVADSERRSQARSASGRNSRPAPRVSKGRVTMSFGATIEKLAKQMAFQRGLKWYVLQPKQQDAFYALAEFALGCLLEVEQMADRNKSLPREIGDDEWAHVPERRG